MEQVSFVSWLPCSLVCFVSFSCDSVQGFRNEGSASLDTRVFAKEVWRSAGLSQA